MKHSSNSVTLAQVLASYEKIENPIWVVRLSDMAFLGVNEACVSFYGYSKEAFAHLHIWDLDYFDPQDVVEKRTKRIMEYGYERFETKHYTKEGTLLDVVVSVKVTTIEDEACMVVLMHPLGVHRSHSEQFQAIFESIHDGVLILDVVLNKFIYANHAILNMVDYSNEEITKLSLQDIALDSEQLEVAYQLALVGEQSSVLEFAVKRKDKSSFIAQVDLSMPYTIEGKDYMAAIIKDVTHEKAREALLDRTTRIYESFFDQLPEAAWLVCPKTKQFKDVNEASVQLYGYTKQEFLTLSITDINTESIETITQKMQALQKAGTISFETKHRTKAGTILDVKVSAKMVQFDGESLLSVICSDITQQKIQEKLYMLNMRQAHMGEMISMIAHQWRQPLTVIGSINMQLQFDASMHAVSAENIAVHAKKIEDQVSYLSQTITDFRNFFKHDRKAQTVRVDALVEKAMSILRSSLHEAQIGVEIDVRDVEVVSLANELVQVLIIILKNSMDAFEGQEIAGKMIEISAYKKEKTVDIVIQDNAGGIQNIALEDIFLPYVSTKNQLNGTGLGLYMAKTMIEDQCHGILSVANTDVGASFTISLPA